ncbi:MAG: 23S rRNA (cytidine(2498)-2'-O)-methyltransferase RlmM [Betaproteobacteria bacterium]|nr:23S rRNA (cytidine(2498)-2'-O)-methyltransferase RlmM [Betaproteobacteria bacterium]
MLLFYCRAGFEVDCAAELSAAAAGAHGRWEHKVGEAHVLWHPAAGGGRKREWTPDFAELAFTRQLLTHARLLDVPVPAERLAVIVAAAKQLGRRFSTVWLEAPDADGPRQLLAGTRGLAAPLQEGLREAGVIASRGPRLHVSLLDRHRVVLGASDPDNSSPWPMGIPRLRFPAGAPSRSGLKLLEALMLFIGEDELLGRMRAGRVAIDLGAAPGGWSQVLASRGVRVVAVDNGSIAPEVMQTQLVEHRREDAFRFRPELPVDWMVCDVVAAPARIAALVAQWVARRWCRETIFNLKLPNKERWREVQRCHGVIERTLAAAEGDHMLRFKHLYHDRDEITGHLRRL